MIGGHPAGLCFREDIDAVTNDNSEFLPHYVEIPKKNIRKFDFKVDGEQMALRMGLYGKLVNKKVYENYSTSKGMGKFLNRYVGTDVASVTVNGLNPDNTGY